MIESEKGRLQRKSLEWIKNISKLDEDMLSLGILKLASESR